LYFQVRTWLERLGLKNILIKKGVQNEGYAFI